MVKCDVVVIGAGIAGLTAARALTAAGRSVLVLEARDRVGGRTLGHTLRGGAVVEMGGQHVGPAQPEVLALIRDLGLETFLSYDEGDGLLIGRGTRGRFRSKDQHPAVALPEASAAEILRLQEEFERLAEAVPLTTPWLAPDAEVLDRQTFEAWLVAQTADELARQFHRMLAHAAFSAETWEMSLLHTLFYIKSNGMLQNIMATTGGNQERRIVGGSQRICERLVEQLPPGSVRLGAAVHAIRQRTREVSVQHDGGEVTARRAIVALPPTLAGRLRYEPPMPSMRDALTQQVPMGAVIKFFAAYPYPFWRQDGLSGLLLALDGPVSLAYDNSPPGGSPGVMTGFLEADHARAAADLLPEVRREKVLAYLRLALGEQASEPTEYREQDWVAEPFTRGCYGGHLGPGVWTRFGPALAAPVGLVHWAGSESSGVCNGYMDGAVRSGQRAATEVLDALP